MSWSISGPFFPPSLGDEDRVLRLCQCEKEGMGERKRSECEQSVCAARNACRPGIRAGGSVVPVPSVLVVGVAGERILLLPLLLLVTVMMVLSRRRLLQHLAL